MPIDPSVLFAGAPANLAPAQYAQMNAQTALVGQQTQNAQLANQQQRMTMQAQQVGMQRAAQTRDAVSQAGAGGDPNDPNTLMKMASAAYNTGDWETGDKLVTASKAQAQAKVGLQKSYLEANQLEQSQIKDGFSTFAAKADAAKAITDPNAQKNTWGQSLQDMITQYQPSPNDSPKLQAMKQQFVQGAQQELQALPTMSPDQLNASIAQHINAGKTQQDWIKEAQEQATRDQQTALANKPTIEKAIGPDGKQTFVAVTPDGTATPIQGGFKPIPPVGPATIQINSNGHSDLGQASSRAQQIANGEIPVPKPTRGDPNALQDVADAKQIMQARGEDPINLAGKYEVTKQGQTSFAPGKPNANAINAVNTAADHTNNILVPAMKALNNGDLPMANKIANAFGIQFGKNEATNFEAVATFLATEVAKVANGGTAPTLNEIQEARKLFPVNGSNAQIGGAIGIANQIMKGKLTAIEQQHENAFGGKSITDRNLLTPAALSIFGTFGKGAQPASQSGPPTIASPSDPAFIALPPGSQFKGPDGILRVKHG